MSALGVAVAVVFMIIPVGASFGNDPLLRLRQLDPQLSPPAATTVCGSPVSHLTITPRSASLYDVARANACQHAAHRRVAVAIALGALIVVLGLAGLAAPSARSGSRALLSVMRHGGGHEQRDEQRDRQSEQREDRVTGPRAEP